MKSYDLFYMRSGGKENHKAAKLMRLAEQVDCVMLSNNKGGQFTTLQGWRTFNDLAHASRMPLYGCFNF